ncbi:hypothetical protein P153DRAFT_368143 [Dothidotthia symphoricarpi CBS 119687]|uniref:Uncharacterized protein n=1 Tax=Dothidotthia symphoricarpi CBS 119687 TaxID=1392245 RepID=A0A6A6A6J6_9PLEO|nr:uncharacterized protein P153DRAFT_368143 [Dothidotthia symphoricarpi CBS 119687]KAF2127509.1 hypothetical protein P153DRAFT_368143 [Dothidotthia symphoricarpi CBS 119687]
MGQSQSQQPVETPEPAISAEERAQALEEMRAKQQAALDKRFAKKPTAALTAIPQATKASRKLNALEQMSKENVGWRDADAQADLRRWD